MSKYCPECGGKLGKQKAVFAIVLDRSGSMVTGLEETISGFNEMIDTIKNEAKGLETKVYFTTFASKVDKIKGPLSVGSVKKLTKETYVPDGWTALLDAVGQTITSIKNSVNETTSVNVFIISDGEENYSKEFNTYNIRNLITELQNKGNWTFSYMGPKAFDLTKLVREWGLFAGNAMVFDNTSSRGYSSGMSTQTSTLSNRISEIKKGKISSTNLYESSQTDSGG